MNDIHSTEFKKIYNKCKYKLRQWKNKFVDENGRLPTKVDIKSSPASVKEYYKQYWILKTKILEAGILGDDNEADESLVTVLKEQTNSIELNTDKPQVESSSKGLPVSKENCVEDEKSTINAWGSHLNKIKKSNDAELEKCTLLTETVAGRLFRGSSFKKRNPRKALSFSKKKSNKTLEPDEGCKSFDVQDSGLTSSFSEFDSQEPSLLDNESFSVENECSDNIKALITSTTSLSPLLNKIQYTGGDNTSAHAQPVSLIQAIASDPSIASKPVRSLDAGWVVRCNEAEGKEERKSNSDSGFESLLPDSREESKNFESSDDDLIGSSDNESDTKSRLSCYFSSQKRKFESSPLSLPPDTPPVETPTEVHVSKKIRIDSPVESVQLTRQNEVKKAVLEKKIKSGTLNDNFVKINLKKKVFVRGKKNFNFGKYKKQTWKNKKKNLHDGGESGGVVQCYKCGETGHFSRYCQKSVEDQLLAVDGEEEEEELPTLEEAEKMGKEKGLQKKQSLFTVEKAIVEEISRPVIEPYYQLNPGGTRPDTPAEVYEILEKFGHSEFRPGQEEAIMRILCGQSTLLTIATGGGKSLCYQLPAYLYAKRSSCITLVVSPLVSLMEDQVSSSRSFFKLGCLHTSQTQKQRDTVVEDAKNGKLHALLVSPEAVTSGDSSAGFGNIFQKLPPVAFACIDEVHCVSQWSHNFRPSYLMISKVLREKFGITTVLGLTATATISTIESITRQLDIPRCGVIKDVPLPDNLFLSVSRDENKDEALVQLLKSSKFQDAKSILIYCTRRDECERLAVLIRTLLQTSFRNENQKTSKRFSWNAESYHAGMASGRRRQVQKAFMCGNLRIVVATVAFGMGINKQDIRGVIHYNMPKDFESYVQEVGRAGRDGLPAYCHLFLDSKGRDLNELRRHIHSDSVDRHVLRKLLQRVFVECDCKTAEKTCEGHEVAFDCSDTIKVLDIPEENIYTLLCYLELQGKIKVLSAAYTHCKISSYKGIKAIASAAKKCPPLAYACASTAKFRKEKSNVLEFNVIEVANKLSWNSGLVKSQLKNIEWEMSQDGKWKKTGIAVEFSNLGFRVCARGDMTPSELDEALDYLTERVEKQEKRAANQLDITFSTFDHFATDCFENYSEARSDGLKQAIRKYFETEEIDADIPVKRMEIEDFDPEEVAGDIRNLICTYRDNSFNGRAVARIFHGIQSPNYPASLWFRCRYWRKHIDKDFKKIISIATREILRLKI